MQKVADKISYANKKTTHQGGFVFLELMTGIEPVNLYLTKDKLFKDKGTALIIKYYFKPQFYLVFTIFHIIFIYQKNIGCHNFIQL